MIEVTVVVSIIALLIGILIPTAQAVRNHSYITQCASHMQRLGQAMTMYITVNRSLPRTTYVPGDKLVNGTGVKSTDPFAADGPQPNDITASIHLLRSTQKLPAELFICPFTDTEKSVPDPASAQTQANFSDYHLNLGYSFACPFPESGHAVRPARLLSKSFILAGDLNPGLPVDGDNPEPITLKSSASRQRLANSGNHGRDGQNLLFGDGHVEWMTTVFAGPLEDNIYTNRDGSRTAGPTDDLDTLLLPAEK
jgi:prepilin-type processing-associated H-X9-DG protein